MPIHLIFKGDRSLGIVEGNAPYKISTNDRITKTLLTQHKPIICKPNPIKIAQKYKEIYDRLNTPSMTQVAKEFEISRVRVHQLLSLFKLDQRIIRSLLKCNDPIKSNFWNERKLRKLLKIKYTDQYSEFKKINSNNHHKSFISAD